MGPTASGKSALAESLADKIDAALLSADAFQIYRGFDIGTAKPDRRELYEFIDIRDPHEGFGVGEFVALATARLRELFDSGRNAIMVGGTGLYIRAVFESYSEMHPPPDPALRASIAARLEASGLEELARELRQIDPNAAEQVDLSNPRRVSRAMERAISQTHPIQNELPPFRKIKLGLMPPVEALHRSIERRLSAMMQNGFAKEVEDLLANGVADTAPAMRAIGYRSMSQAVRGEVSMGEAFDSILAETRRYAKRQRTWLRKEPNITYFADEPGEDVLASVLELPHLN